MGQFVSRYQRLSVQDAGFLHLEHAGLPQHVAILAVVEGEPLHDQNGRLRLDAIQQLDRRLHLAPRLRQLVLCPPLGQGLPLWVDDPTFDLANHVRAVQVPPPGGEQQLLALCDQLGLRLLDRGRPLWELWLVTGLAEGRVGLVLKLHHALADGLAAVQIAGALLLDATPDPPLSAPPPWQPRPVPSGWALVADNLQGRSAAVAAALARLRHPGRLLAQAQVLVGAWRMVRDGRRHRRSPLRRPVGGRRRLVLARARLAVVKDIAHAHQATVNDVLLAAVAGGLRTLLLARGVPVAGLTLRASVPVALRAPAAAAALGNQVGLMVVPLPVEEPDPVRRLRRIAQATIDRKRRPEVLAGLRPVGSLTVLRALNRYSRHQHLVDLFVTNVPGPQVPLFVVGARLLEAFPLVQVAGNVPLSVAALSYDGQLNLGVQSDPDALPDVDTFAAGLRRSLEELAAATRPLLAR
jgi:WS/DGAT/MGAT family acyltransferase